MDKKWESSMTNVIKAVIHERHNKSGQFSLPMWEYSNSLFRIFDNYFYLKVRKVFFNVHIKRYLKIEIFWEKHENIY